MVHRKKQTNAPPNVHASLLATPRGREKSSLESVRIKLNDEQVKACRHFTHRSIVEKKHDESWKVTLVIGTHSTRDVIG